MTIDPDVRGIAAHFGLDARLIQAVVNAEGNIVRAVQCSIPSVTTREKALDVLCRSCVHAMSDYIKTAGLGPEFVVALGARWAPRGAENDPKNLNAHWVANVRDLWNV